MESCKERAIEITLGLLKNHNACSEGVEWFERQLSTERRACMSLEEVCDRLLAEGRFDWANWLVVTLMGQRSRVKYAIYAARKVLPVFERYDPDDKRPRAAIEAAEESVISAADAARAADDAARAARAARAAARAVDADTDATADAAADYAVNAAAYAVDAAYAAVNICDTNKSIRKGLIACGIRLLTSQKR